MIPQTPPRVKRVISHTPQETPQTKHNANTKKFKTPTSKKQVFPQTPDTVGSKLKLPSTNLQKFTNSSVTHKLSLPPTPEKSPRRKRKQTADKLNFGLLLPIPSKVGSGRTPTHSNVKIINNAPKLNHEYFAEINNEFQFEEDLVDHPPKPELSDSSKQFLEKSKDISKQLFPNASLLPSESTKSLFSETLIFNDEDSFRTTPGFSENSIFNPSTEPEVFEPPLTPRRQVISSKLLADWYDKSPQENVFNVTFSEYEDMKSQSQSTKLPNPFDENEMPASTPTSQNTNPFAESGKSIDYATHMELVNNRTGKRTVVELTEEQKQIRPKKLDFSGL
jgi:hypothetical protein